MEHGRPSVRSGQAATGAGVWNGRDVVSVGCWRTPEEEVAARGSTSMMKRVRMAVMTLNRSLGKALRFRSLQVRATKGKKARRANKNDSPSVLARLNPHVVRV